MRIGWRRMTCLARSASKSRICATSFSEMVVSSGILVLGGETGIFDRCTAIPLLLLPLTGVGDSGVHICAVLRGTPWVGLAVVDAFRRDQ